MHSRAYILLQKEFEELQRHRNEGVSAFPVSEDLLQWEAEIQGLQNSICDGLVFQLTIDFTPEYNLVPPVVKFVTIPFHPNVNPYTGQPSIDILDSQDDWNTNYTLRNILLAVQILLSHPRLENPVNMEAAQLLINNEPMYRTIIHKLFQPEPRERDGSLGLYEKPQKSFRVVKTISFNDYYKTWSEIATTKSAELSKTSFLGDPDFMERYYKWRGQRLPHHKQWKWKFEFVKWRFARENKSPEPSSHQFVQRMVVAPSPTELSYGSVESESDYYEWKNENWTEKNESEESWEDEVDKLVAWTSALDVGALDYEN
ncbi:ubiquitin-conjugating enzyme E2 U [Peromyscus maniculatus bairdii]|uniref:ubiquitin-conjugating enzyme E2 U n=1 Tax=Peromyscus maniculatus bairdii TaxID=230844 RepID=UPI00077DE085|nr:ubiquitin-conjugating enzyme E2 U [Peromyscus maniculatus bairdii]